MSTQTTGQRFTATLRKSFRIGARTRNHRDGLNLRNEMLESIENAIHYPGYYGPERTELSRAASGVLASFRKHYDGYRIDPTLRYRIECMTPYQFAALLGEMVDAGVTNVGEGERFFQQMREAA